MRFIAGRWMDEADFEAFGPPETSVEMPGDLTLGLVIPHPFGRDTDAMLTIHAQETPDDPGGIITLAIGSVVQRATVNIDINLHSNPRRRGED